MHWLCLTRHNGTSEWFGIANAESWWVREGFVFIDASDGMAKRLWAVPRSLVRSVYVTDMAPTPITIKEFVSVQPTSTPS
jgi:hypothetical protein